MHVFVQQFDQFPALTCLLKKISKKWCWSLHDYAAPLSYSLLIAHPKLPYRLLNSSESQTGCMHTLTHTHTITYSFTHLLIHSLTYTLTHSADHQSTAWDDVAASAASSPVRELCCHVLDGSFLNLPVAVPLFCCRESEIYLPTYLPFLRG